MLSNEKIAHDLAIVYLSNRYGVHLDNNFRIRGGDSLGSIESSHFPSTDEPLYEKVDTGHKGFFGGSKKERVETGRKVDSLFAEILKDYRAAYEYFLLQLEASSL